MNYTSLIKQPKAESIVKMKQTTQSSYQKKSLSKYNKSLSKQTTKVKVIDSKESNCDFSGLNYSNLDTFNSHRRNQKGVIENHSLSKYSNEAMKFSQSKPYLIVNKTNSIYDTNNTQDAEIYFTKSNVVTNLQNIDSDTFDNVTSDYYNNASDAKDRIISSTCFKKANSVAKLKTVSIQPQSKPIVINYEAISNSVEAVNCFQKSDPKKPENNLKIENNHIERNFKISNTSKNAALNNLTITVTPKMNDQKDQQKGIVRREINKEATKRLHKHNSVENVVSKNYTKTSTKGSLNHSHIESQANFVQHTNSNIKSRVTEGCESSFKDKSNPCALSRNPAIIQANQAFITNNNHFNSNCSTQRYGAPNTGNNHMTRNNNKVQIINNIIGQLTALREIMIEDQLSSKSAAGDDVIDNFSESFKQFSKELFLAAKTPNQSK